MSLAEAEQKAEAAEKAANEARGAHEAAKSQREAAERCRAAYNAQLANTDASDGAALKRANDGLQLEETRVKITLATEEKARAAAEEASRVARERRRAVAAIHETAARVRLAELQGDVTSVVRSCHAAMVAKLLELQDAKRAVAKYQREAGAEVVVPGGFWSELANMVDDGRSGGRMPRRVLWKVIAEVIDGVDQYDAAKSYEPTQIADQHRYGLAQAEQSRRDAERRGR